MCSGVPVPAPSNSSPSLAAAAPRPPSTVLDSGTSMPGYLCCSALKDVLVPVPAYMHQLLVCSFSLLCRNFLFHLQTNQHRKGSKPTSLGSPDSQADTRALFRRVEITFGILPSSHISPTGIPHPLLQ